MTSPISPTRVAITGAAGFLGRALTGGLSRHFPLRTLDVQPAEGPWEQMTGSAADLDAALALCAGCSHLVIAHMAPNRPEVYGAPPIPFQVNVTGVANLFHAACAQGVRRVILISSTAVVEGRYRDKNEDKDGAYLARDTPPLPISLYGLTKRLQEDIAEYYHRMNGMEVAIFRPAHICDVDQLVDKYARQFPFATWGMIDPRDIAEGVRLAILAPKLSYEIFYILGQLDSERHADVNYTRDFLGWTPRPVEAKGS